MYISGSVSASSCFFVVNFHIFIMSGGLTGPFWVIGTQEMLTASSSTITQEFIYNNRWTFNKSLQAYCKHQVFWQNYHSIIMSDKYVPCLFSFCSENNPDIMLSRSFPTQTSKICSIFPHTMQYWFMWFFFKSISFFHFYLIF